MRPPGVADSTWRLAQEIANATGRPAKIKTECCTHYVYPQAPRVRQPYELPGPADVDDENPYPYGEFGG